MGNIARFLGNWGLQWVLVGSILVVVGIGVTKNQLPRTKNKNH